jgi:hypothetical protein
LILMKASFMKSLGIAIGVSLIALGFFPLQGNSATAERSTRIVVSFDDAAIVARYPRGWRRSIPWADLTKVAVLRVGDDPLRPEIFWEFYGHAETPVLVLPGDARGEEALVEALRRTLPGFDDQALVLATNSAHRGSFLLWKGSLRRQ